VNPTREEYQAERWRCSVCNKAHGTEKNAINCCLCAACDKRPATRRTNHWSSSNDICEPCFLRAEREKARKAMKTAEEWVAEQRRRLEAAENDLHTKKCLFEVAAAACKTKKQQTEQQADEHKETH
jgi:hypothetical protein